MLDRIRDARPVASTDGNGEVALEEPFLPSTEFVVVKEEFLAERVTVRRDDDAVTVSLRDSSVEAGQAGLPVLH